MSDNSLPAEKNVKKHVAAVHISNRLSLLERKMSNVLLWNAYEDLLKEDIHRIRVKDLADILGYDSNDRALLKQSLVNLMSTVLEWNVLDEKGREKDWEASTMLEYTRMKGAYCYYSYGKKLKEKLYNPAMYERINLTIQKKFSSGYALALYENCLRFKNTGTTGWIELDRFRKIMGVNPKEYADFRRLNQRVIKGPVGQVNSSSDIILKPEFKREKRRVVAVRFQVSDNPQLSLFGLGKNEKVSAALVAQEKLEHEGAKIEDDLHQYGLTEKQVEWVTAHYDDEYIRENLEIVEGDYKAGKVENVPAYTMAAIKKDYRPKKSKFEEEHDQKKLAKKQAVEQRFQEINRVENLRKEFESETIQNALNRMSAAEYATFEKRFHNEHKENLIYQKFKDDKGIQNRVIKGLFLGFVRKSISQEITEEKFKEYARNQGISLKTEITTAS